MITFTPLSGAARSDHTVPLAYLLQVDDVRILLDCGSPDWCPEPIKGDTEENESPAWEKYCDSLKECVFTSRSVPKHRFIAVYVLLDMRLLWTLCSCLMGICHTLVYIHMPTQTGVSLLLRILPCPSKPWPELPLLKTSKAFAMNWMSVTSLLRMPH